MPGKYKGFYKTTGSSPLTGTKCGENKVPQLFSTFLHSKTNIYIVNVITAQNASLFLPVVYIVSVPG